MSEIGFFGNFAHLRVSNLAKMTLLDSAKSSSHNKSAEKLVKFHTVIIRVNSSNIKGCVVIFVLKIGKKI